MANWEKFRKITMDSYLNKIGVNPKCCTRAEDSSIASYNIDIPEMNVHERVRVMYPGAVNKFNNVVDEHALILDYNDLIKDGYTEHTHFIFTDLHSNLYDYRGDILGKILVDNGVDKSGKPFRFDLDPQYMIKGIKD